MKINFKPIRYTAYAAIPVFALLLGAELVCKRYYNTRPKYWAHAQRLTSPAYTSKPWFSEPFLTDSFTQPGGWFTPADTRLLFPKDYQSRYFTVIRGARQTAGFQWDLADGLPLKLFLLGGSTTYCSEVPDELTWASQLQHRLADNPATQRVRVVNYGVTSVNSSQEVERLKYELAQGNRPDVCVFYNGVNEVSQGVYNNNPQGVIFATEKQHRRSLLQRLRARSYLARAATDAPQKKSTPAHLDNPQQVHKLARQTADLYEANIREAMRVCEQYGISLFVFLQPNLYTITRPLTDHEQHLADNDSRPGMQQCVEAVYPLLKRKIELLRGSGCQAYDLSSVFDANTDPIFLDFCHVESDGNRIVSNAIFARIDTETKRVAKAASGERWETSLSVDRR